MNPAKGKPNIEIKLEQHWRRQYSLFQIPGLARKLAEIIEKDTGLPGLVRAEGSENWVATYSPEGSIEKLTAGMIDLIKHNPSAIEKDIAALHQSGEQFANIFRGMEINDKTPTETLFKLNQQLFDAWAPYAAHLWKSFYFVEAGGKAFENVIKKHFSADDTQAAITFYSEPSQLAHVRTIADYFRRTSDTNERAKYIQKEFPWLFSTDPYSPPATEQQIIEYVASFSLPPIEEHHPVQPQKPLSAEAKQIIKIYQDMLYLKDKRDEYRRRAFYSARPLVLEIMQRLKCTLDQLWYVLPHELPLFQTNREEFLEEVKNRQKSYLFETSSSGEVLLSGDEAAQYLTKQNTEGIKTVKGVTGSGGKITGVVQIIRSAQEVAKFEKGKIFVAVTTNPDYVPAMQKATAFITDEGGITCHAAIVAREMKRPCVVGTKNATKVLKDGDHVEVDADKGIVRKL